MFAQLDDAHSAWRRVKSSAMKRPYLDCGCKNDGVTDTYLHLGCPRISCRQHAEDPHECQHYEPEAPPREEPPDAATIAAVDAVLRNVAAVDPVFAVDVSRDGTGVVAVSNGPGHLAFIDEPGFRPGSLGEWPPDPEPRADVRAMTPDEATRFDAQQRLSLECSRSRPMCSGCDGGAMDGFTCLHECHSEPDAAARNADHDEEHVPVEFRGPRRPFWRIW